MAVAETAELLTRIRLQDQLTPGLQKVRGELGLTQNRTGGLVGALNTITRPFGGLRGIAGGVSTAFATLRSRIGSLVSGPLGIIGLGAGLFSLGNFLTSSVEKAKDFAGEVLKLSGLTGLSAERTSALAAAFEHFGITSDIVFRTVGLAEKNLFRLAGTAKSAREFQDKYGLSLVDSHGKLLNFEQLLLRTSDYWLNKNIPAAQKAAALAAIYGRNWQAIIPILGAGRQKIAEVEEAAAKFGLTIGTKDIANYRKFRDAMREWGTALSGLKLQIGLAVIPALTDLAKAATGFLAGGGRDKIVAFFKGILDWGRRAIDFIKSNIVPGISAVIDGWKKIPEPIRNLLFRGFAANTTIGFLIGTSPLEWGLKAGQALIGAIAGNIGGKVGGSIVEKIFGKAVGGLLDRGSPANPMWVAVVGGGLGGLGGGGGLLGTLGKGGLLGGLGISASAIAATALAALATTFGLAFLLKATGGFENEGATATSYKGGLSVGPKGQLRVVGVLGARDSANLGRTANAVERNAIRTEELRQTATRQLAATNAARQISSADQARLRAAENANAAHAGAAARATQARIQSLHPRLSQLQATDRAGFAQLRTAINASRSTLSSISSRTASVRAAVVQGHAITGRGFQRTVDAEHGVSRAAHGTTAAVNRKKLSVSLSVRNSITVSNTEIWTKLNRLRVAMGNDNTNTGGSV